MVQINELRAYMARKQITQKELAQELGISEKTMTDKMNARRDFGLEEAKKMIKILEIENPSDIFFA